MSQTITSPTVHFDKGQLQVIILPEEPEYCFTYSHKYPCDGYNEKSDRGYCTCDLKEDEYEVRVAYARAHPVDTRLEDEGKIKSLWRRKYDPFCEVNLSTLNDGKEYKLERVRMEIKVIEVPFLDSTISKQVACLIEDDKQ